MNCLTVARMIPAEGGGGNAYRICSWGNQKAGDHLVDVDENEDNIKWMLQKKYDVRVYWDLCGLVGGLPTGCCENERTGWSGRLTASPGLAAGYGWLLCVYFVDITKYSHSSRVHHHHQHPFLKIPVFWYVTPCTLHRYRRFERTCCQHFQVTSDRDYSEDGVWKLLRNMVVIHQYTRLYERRFR